MQNIDIARLLEEVADLLEIQGANPFRVRAYRNAVRTVEAQTTPFAKMVAEGRELTELPGIGKEMAGHIAELIETGRLAVREEMLAEVPRGLLDLMRLPNVGPKRARKLWEELGVESVDDLEAAAQAGRVAALEGFGAKSQEKILAGIADFRQHQGRMRLADADAHVEPLLAHLREAPELERIEVAGSYRRRRAARCRGFSPWATSRATCRCTPPGRTARTRSRRCSSAAPRAATVTSPSPTTAKRWR